jgi:surface polysaccharide O-acyltransferase-like enzyme
MWANNLKVFAAFAVIILHVAAAFVGGISLTDLEYGNHNWWAGNIYDSITRWCVPLFVMISGYFLLNKEEPLSIFINKRMSKLLIPLFFWSLFFTLWIVLKGTITGELSEKTLKIIAIAWLMGKPYYHLWFVFMIPFLYLSTPALRVVFKKLSRNEALFFIIFCFSLAILNTLFTNILSFFDLNSKVSLFTNSFLSYIGYFCLGGYIAKYNIKIKTNMALFALLLAWLITIFGSYFFTYNYFYSYLSINTVIASIALFLLIKKFFDKNLKLDSFAKLNFGIYLVHPVFLDVFTFLGKDRLLDNMSAYIYIPLVSVFVFFSSYGAAFFMSKLKFFHKCV